MIWEHTYDDVDTEDEEASILDTRGAQGWQLVAVRQLSERKAWNDRYIEPTRLYFKRPQAAASEPQVPA